MIAEFISKYFMHDRETAYGERHNETTMNLCCFFTPSKPGPVRETGGGGGEGDREKLRDSERDRQRRRQRENAAGVGREEVGGGWHLAACCSTPG